MLSWIGRCTSLCGLLGPPSNLLNDDRAVAYTPVATNHPPLSTSNKTMSNGSSHHVMSPGVVEKGGGSGARGSNESDADAPSDWEEFQDFDSETEATTTEEERGKGNGTTNRSSTPLAQKRDSKHKVGTTTNSSSFSTTSSSASSSNSSHPLPPLRQTSRDASSSSSSSSTSIPFKSNPPASSSSSSSSPSSSSHPDLNGDTNSRKPNNSTNSLLDTNNSISTFPTKPRPLPPSNRPKVSGLDPFAANDVKSGKGSSSADDDLFASMGLAATPFKDPVRTSVIPPPSSTSTSASTSAFPSAPVPSESSSKYNLDDLEVDAGSALGGFVDLDIDLDIED